jgi:hypothetical protein
MVRILTIAFLLFGFSASTSAQRYRDARTYYREFASENRRIIMKNMRYLEGTVKGEDPRRIDKYREMVVEQLQESKRTLERVGGFNENDLLQREYLQAIDLFLEAYQESMEKAKELKAERYKNFEKLQEYFTVMEETEALIFDAAYKMNEADEYFAKQNNVNLRVDEDTEEKWRRLDLLSLYMRELTFNFYRVDTRLSAFLEAAKGDNKDTLSNLVSDIRAAVQKSQDALADMPKFDGKDYAYDELDSYLSDISESIDERFRPLADQLANNFLDEDDYEDAQDELSDLENWHKKARQDFFQEQEYVVESYLDLD